MSKSKSKAIAKVMNDVKHPTGGRIHKSYKARLEGNKVEIKQDRPISKAIKNKC